MKEGDIVVANDLGTQRGLPKEYGVIIDVYEHDDDDYKYYEIQWPQDRCWADDCEVEVISEMEEN